MKILTLPVFGLALILAVSSQTFAATATAPTITSVTANPATLWPPNHKYHSVTVSVSATDTVDPAPVSKIISVTSNEPSDAFHRGTPDFVITGPLTVDLRAERLGGGTGRVYTITVQCTNSSNISSTGTVTVTVSHDKGHGNGHHHGHEAPDAGAF